MQDKLVANYEIKKLTFYLCKRRRKRKLLMAKKSKVRN